MNSTPKEIGSSKLGFFSKPVLLTEGQHAGKVMKSYKFIKDQAICEALLKIHSQYIPQLEKAGIRIPKTEAEIVKKGNKYSIRVFQEAFPADTMARRMMEEGDLDTCLMVMNGVLDGAITELNFLYDNPDEKMGFHPTLRNYAIVDNTFWYFDTFPPMANLTQDELEWYILHFAPYKVPNWFKKFAKKYTHKVTDEYYQADKMFLGIVGSSCRLRQDYVSEFLSLAKKKVLELKNEKDRSSILKQLENPPKLPFIWTFVRKILGKEGKKNIS